MKLPKASPAVARQANTQPAVAAVEPAFLDQMMKGLFGLGALVCEAFPPGQREECLRGYNTVAGPVQTVLQPLTSLL